MFKERAIQPNMFRQTQQSCLLLLLLDSLAQYLNPIVFTFLVHQSCKLVGVSCTLCSSNIWDAQVFAIIIIMCVVQVK